VPLAATAAAAAEVRAQKRRRAEEVSALREGMMEQWRHTGVGGRGRGATSQVGVR